MLDFKQIKELIELVANRGLDGVELERAGFRLTIDGKQTRNPAAPPAAAAEASPIPAAIPGAAPVSPAEAPAAPESKEAQDADALDGAYVIKSPIVGTYYRASSPESAPFVQIGDRVEKGQVLCIVEAMKLMNEIESEVAGEIVAIFPDNAQPVEFDEPLFAVRSA